MKSFDLSRLLSISIAISVIAFFSVSPTSAEDWPNWRGPRHDGASAEMDLPISWQASEEGGEHNIAWKCDLPEWGTSTPVIWGDAIFLTSHAEDRDLLLLRIDRLTGKIVWQRTVGTGETPRQGGVGSSEGRHNQRFHNEHNLASPSVSTDGEIVLVHYGNGDLASYDFDGVQLWKRNMQEEHGQYSTWWGHASSPLLHEDLAIMLSMQDSCDDLQDKPYESYIVAYNKRTGQPVWKTLRMTGSDAEYADAYTTPFIWEHEGRTELVVLGAETIDAYNPMTGERYWFLPGLEGNRIITGPLPYDGMIFMTRGKRGPTVAIRPQGLGLLSNDAILWTSDRNTPDSPAPVVCNGLFFTVADNGFVRCFEPETGEMYWEHRLRGIFRASPLAADGRIYATNVKGETTVLLADKSGPEVLSENKIDDITFATPIVSGGQIFIRGHKSLYCFGK